MARPSAKTQSLTQLGQTKEGGMAGHYGTAVKSDSEAYFRISAHASLLTVREACHL